MELTERLIADNAAASFRLETRGQTHDRAGDLAGAARRPRLALPRHVARRGSRAGEGHRGTEARSREEGRALEGLELAQSQMEKGNMTATAALTETDFKVADLSLAEFGRKEIRLAEHEMPGLMAIRARVRRPAAAQGRAHHGLAAHDDPDRRADRDARRARRRGPLVQLQHLLHPGSRGGGDRRGTRGHAREAPRGTGLRLEGRDARGVLVVHRAGAALAGGRRASGPART